MKQNKHLYLFLEKCFIAWNFAQNNFASPYFWIYDYNGNLLQELSYDDIYSNGNRFRMSSMDSDPILGQLSPYYGSCGMSGDNFSDFDILMLPVIRDNKVTFLVIDNT